MMFTEHGWWTAEVVIAAACIGFAGIGLYIASQRWQLLAVQMTAFSVFMLALGLLQLVPETDTSTSTLRQIIVAVTAASGAFSLISFGARIRGILAHPTREQVQEVNSALERANRELEAFTASVSHDLRSPLTTIAGQAGLLEMSAGNKLDDDQKRRLHRIHASVKQMSELIEALLNLSRISQTKVEREVIDVSAVAERILSELAQHEPQRQVDVHVAPGLTLHGDRLLMTCVLENLLNNAWKFTSKTSRARIEVCGSLHGNQRSISVRDNGCGFEMTHHEKLFHPFQRLHTQAEFPGSGIGLATAKRIVALHGGRLWAESKPEEGATFWFSAG